MSAADQAKWQTMPMLAYDVETTGVDVWTDRIVTACVVEFHPGKRPTSTTWLANPGIEIPAEAEAVHGITTAYAAEHGQNPAQVLYELTGRLALWMGRRFPVVAMNAAFDFSILEAENRRHGVAPLAGRLTPKPVGPIIDPMVLDKKVDPYRPAHCDGKQKRAPHCTCGAEDKRLTGLCRHYGVPLVAAHSAESDAASSVRLARAIIAAKPQAFRGMTIGGLHQAQKQWRHEQMKGLREYFDRQGTEHDGCCPEWPVHMQCAPQPPVAPTSETQGALL